MHFSFNHHKRGQAANEYNFVNEFKKHLVHKLGMRPNEVLSIMGRFFIRQIKKFGHVIKEPAA